MSESEFDEAVDEFLDETYNDDTEQDAIFEAERGIKEENEFGLMCLCFHYKEDHDENNQCKVRGCSCRTFKERCSE